MRRSSGIRWAWARYRFRGFDIRSGNRKDAPVYKDVIIPKEIKLSSRAYQKLVAKIEGKPEERILSYLMLRSLKQARYSEENVGHFALAATHYTHFTSPIRRYPDLIVHRLLTASLDGASYSNETELKSIADECSLTERRAADAERELVEWKKAKFMEGRVGEEFDGLVISTARYGLFVELADLFVEGLVPIDTLAGGPLRVSRERAQDHRSADAARVFDRRTRTRDSGTGRSAGAQASVFDRRAGETAGEGEDQGCS